METPAYVSIRTNSTYQRAVAYCTEVEKLAFRWWLAGGLVCTTTGADCLAQTDTLSGVPLSAVTVRASAPERFLAGQKIQRIDSTTLLQFRFGALTDLLTFTTPLAFKNYGPGQLATVAFRGTSANHTAVLWNGININQPNLGQTDFSTLPVVGFDQVAVQYGSGASAVGSDAVGGSILLGSRPTQTRGIGLTVGYQLGSFRNTQTQAGLQYGTALGTAWQLSGKSLAYQNRQRNDYPFTERRHYFVEQSTTAQRGLVQDLVFRHKSGRQLSVNAWLTDNDLVLAPHDSVSREQTRTQSARFLTTYDTGPLTLRIGWIRDRLDYAKGYVDPPSRTLTDRLLARAEREFTLLPGASATRLSLRVGGEWSHYRTRTDGYGGQLITENRQDLYALLRWQMNRWLVSANLRQAFVTRFNPPPTPSLGAEYVLVQRHRLTLTARGSVGRSYRVPTLNERYWRVLGNPNLRPEQGFNTEAGLFGKVTLTDYTVLTFDATMYRNRVTDWSYWNPDYGYRVENLQTVMARGAELNGSLAWARASWQAGLRTGLALTRSSQERAYSTYAQDVLGKQLPYVPLLTGTANAYVQRGRARLTVQHQTVSRRNITFDNSQFFPALSLTNILLETVTRLGPVSARVQGQVNNVFDALAFSVKRNALPGRTIAINMLLTLPSNTL